MSIFWAIEKFKLSIERLKYDSEINSFMENTKNRTAVLVEYEDFSASNV